MNDELHIQYDPQECANCEDLYCPYSHRESWSVWLGDKYVIGPYDSELEASASIIAVLQAQP